MILVLLDTTTSPATPTAPSFYVMDTAAGLVKFVSGGPTTFGTIDFNQGQFVFTPGSVALWSFLQAQFTNALLQNLPVLSFAGTVGPTVTSASGVSTAGGVTNIVGTGFKPGCSGYLDYTSGSALPLLGLGSVIYTSDTAIGFTLPALTAGTYTLTIINPDFNYSVFSTGVVIS